MLICHADLHTGLAEPVEIQRTGEVRALTMGSTLPSYTSLPYGGLGHAELCFIEENYNGTGYTSQGAAAMSITLRSFDIFTHLIH
jgi:hypothetical protein